ncbi:MAG: DUF6588 family protein [Bacteroidota bacterium]
MKQFHRVPAAVVIAGALIFTAPHELLGQTLQENLEKLAEDAAKGYVSPIVSGFGADLNSGWYHRAPKGTKFSINLEFGLIGMGAFFSDEHRTFSTSGSFNFDQPTAEQMIPDIQNPTLRNALIDSLVSSPFAVTIFGPTVVGSEADSITVALASGNITLRDPITGRDTTFALLPAVLPVTGLLEDAPLLPLAAPQISVGTVLGTALTLRYLPAIELNDEIGKLKYFGFGIQHNPSVWFPMPLVVDVSVGFFTQKLTVGDLFESNATHFGIQASKTFGPGLLSLTPYLGVGWESSTMRFTYTFIGTSVGGSFAVPVDFELEGENTTRLTAGVSLKLAIFNINADYSLGNTKTASIGLMFAI